MNANKNTTFLATLIERGNGWPQDGELVYDHEANDIYRVVNTGSIRTGHPMGNTVNARLERTDKVPEDFSEGELDEMGRGVLVTDVREG